MRLAVAVSLVLSAAALATGQTSGTFTVAHDPVACVVAGQHPQLTAEIAPRASDARGRVYFRAGEAPDWYYVEMKVDAGHYLGVLPRPLPTTRTIEYYIEASGSAYALGRTADVAPRVVRDSADCHGGRTAVALANAKVVVHGLAKAAARTPAGFSSAGIVTAGGVSTGLVLGGVVLAGGATAGAIVATHKDDGPSPTPTPAPTPDPCYRDPNNYLEIGRQCAGIQSVVHAGCPIGFQVGVGRWPTIAAMQEALAGHHGVIAVDGVRQPVTYEGPTIHTGEGEPSGYGDRARTVWTATAGTHTVTGFWTLRRDLVSTCTFVVP